jgi:hypothetical protein
MMYSAMPESADPRAATSLPRRVVVIATLIVWSLIFLIAVFVFSGAAVIGRSGADVAGVGRLGPALRRGCALFAGRGFRAPGNNHGAHRRGALLCRRVRVRLVDLAAAGVGMRLRLSSHFRGDARRPLDALKL